MKISYCLPILSASKTEVIELIQSNLGAYGYFEVWLDYVEELDEDFLRELVELTGDKLVVTFRRQELETPRMEPAKRQKLLESLNGTLVLVDLDVANQKNDLDLIKTSGLNVQLLASYHNYQETPDTLQLETIIDTMKTYQPAVYKLSTLCKTEGDALRLLELLLKLKGKGLRAIVSGMGDYGSVTRIFGTLWGNEMVFAPLTEAESSAPGQLTREQLETIFKELA